MDAIADQSIESRPSVRYSILNLAAENIAERKELPSMAKKPRSESVNRRNFLKTAASGAALAVTAKAETASAQQTASGFRNATAPILTRPAPGPAGDGRCAHSAALVGEKPNEHKQHLEDS